MSIQKQPVENLALLLLRARKDFASNPAVVVGDEELSYLQLFRRAMHYRHLLKASGIVSGDCVGVYFEKSIETLPVIYGILLAGAVFVPLERGNPPKRIADQIQLAQIKIVVSSTELIEKIQAILCDLKIVELLDSQIDSASFDREISEADLPGSNEVAYVLFTSGSTGQPKGARLTHRNALSFLYWARDLLTPESSDIFANHAPLQFGISIFDLFLPAISGSRVHLLPETLKFHARFLAEYIASHRINIWYSVPTAIIQMIDRGRLLDLKHEFKYILYAGEVFAEEPLKKVRDRYTRAKIFNFYGNTETNVVSFHEIKEVKKGESRIIGEPASGDELLIKDDELVGELVVRGPTVMRGYTGSPEIENATYYTGDIVEKNSDGEFVYFGRRDSMVKISGIRMNLLEVEAVVSKCAGVSECLVIFEEGELHVLASLDPAAGKAISLSQLRAHCAEYLPKQIRIDGFIEVSEFPLNANGKKDRLKAKENFLASLKRPLG